MNTKNVENLLNEIVNFARNQNLSKNELAEQLGIPYGTFKKWFFKGRGRRIPSHINVEKIRNFLTTKENKEIYWRKLWFKILDWEKTQHRFRDINELADTIGWEEKNLNHHFNSGEIPPRLVIEKIAETIGLDFSSLDYEIRKADEKTEKIKYILLLLEDELRWFRDGSERAREVIREKLDFGDVGYISSLLTMIGDENRFKRWLSLTSNRFYFFRKKGRKND